MQYAPDCTPHPDPAVSPIAARYARWYLDARTWRGRHEYLAIGLAIADVIMAAVVIGWLAAGRAGRGDRGAGNHGDASRGLAGHSAAGHRPAGHGASTGVGSGN